MSKIHLPIAELKSALIGLGKVISKRSTLPVLGHIKVERTKDGWVLLTATNLDAFVSVRLEQPVEGAAETILVSHENLNRITKSCLPNDLISVEQTAKEKVSITYPIGGQLTTHVSETLAAEDFPAIPKIKTEPVALPDAVRSSIHAALECCSEDETRQILNGVYLDVTNDATGHHVVATDGRHLFAANSFKVALPRSVIIPDHAFLHWKEFSRDGEWQLRVGEETKGEQPHLQVSSRRWRFIHRAIEGNYPNWRQVCVSSADVKTVVQLPEENLEAIAQLITRLPEAPNDQHHAVGLKVVGKRLFVQGRNALTEPWMEVEITGSKIIGPDIHVFLNRQYVQKALKFGLHKVELQEPLSSVQFSKEGQQLVIMPVRVDAPSPNQNAPQRPQEPKNEASREVSPTTERNNIMPTASPAVTNGNGTNGHAVEEKPSVETAIDKIENIKGSYREAIHGLNDLADILKQVQKEQKSTNKEVQSVRMTLERLQSVRI